MGILVNAFSGAVFEDKNPPETLKAALVIDRILPLEGTCNRCRQLSLKEV